MKKAITLLLSGVILATSIPAGNSRADMMATNEIVADSDISILPMPEKPSRGALDPSQDALEAAIKAVKGKITIPKEYSEFDYYFYGSTSYADTYWNLTWRNPKDSSYIQVSCDKNNHITHYSKYDYSAKSTGIPKYLKKELKSTADQFIKQIAPQISSKVEYLDANYESIYSGTYNYSYQRKENGVSFPDNKVNVSVNSVSGEVMSASVQWLYDVTIPKADTKLTKEEAAKIIGENLKMELVYRTDYYRIYDSNKKDYVQKAYLVYEPNPGYISVDAKTGKVYLTRSEWIDKTRYAGSGDYEKEEAVNDMAKTASDVLTEEEIAKINELEELITKDKAIEKVTKNSYLYIDKNLMSYNAYLNKSYNGNKEANYVWNIELRDPRPVDYDKDSKYYRAYANAQVDAKTGKILSFKASLDSNYNDKNGTWNEVKIKYNKEESQTKLESFLKSQIKDRFTNSKLVTISDDYVAFYKNDEPVYGGYQYKYNRVNEGVIYPYDHIYGAVDGVSGKIYSYRSSWNDNVVFESPKGAMSSEKAFEHYISKEGYQLVYEVNEINIYDPSYKGESRYYDDSEAYSMKYEVRLVYRPDVNPALISPFTGEQLTYDGKVYKKIKPYSYLDVADTRENREILLLSDMNIGFEGEYFYPEKEITEAELIGLMEKVGYGYYTEEDKATENKVTNEELAKSFIQRLGLEKIAAINGIYNTGYHDQSEIRSDAIGAVALAKGLGLMTGDNNNYFYPKKYVTRKEAVHLILNFIKVQRDGIY
ncbi:S-layer homology domain-containing protein [Mobilitalea sibirica]|uniref:S-layer homology domain-containing protein n=1 Tax=Mobilitalea sibirica TaxID=1462919 RepID=A0A8J7HCY3_9FIRM|nr:YcdB/YcdC domain-containing protein [Mobilitalea sibirica]MBH1941422.1 S-layer homology domain-containing protein [Mobilitalea sibirica]